MTDVLDITDWKQHGQGLMNAINNAVADTQRYIIAPLPSFLLMTRPQFDDLMRESGLQSMWADSAEQLYRTKYGVMEVQVKE